MAISKDKVKLQISVTKTTDDILNKLVEASANDVQPVTKSNIIETALKCLFKASYEMYERNQEQAKGGKN